VEDDQTGDENSYSISPDHPGFVSLSDSEKAETLTDTLEIYISFPAVIEMVEVALGSYFMTLANEPKLTKF
jgi:hypothetical protein